MLNCFSRISRRGLELRFSALFLVLVSVMPVVAQTTTADKEVDLIVDGQVERVFRDGDDFLVQILVQAAEAPQLDPAGAIRYPALGQCVYVHVESGDSAFGRVVRSPGPAVPNPNSPIRARLSAGESGRWVAAGPDWFDADLAFGRSRKPSLDQPQPRVISLGVEAERVFVGGESGLKVIRVEPQSPAAKAGIEPGDALMTAAGASLESQAQLEELFRNARGTMEVIVRDIRSGRDVKVQIEAGGRPEVIPSAQTLGVVTETAFYGGNAALKVTRIVPDSPALLQGIVPGLLILKAGGKAVGKPEELTDVVERTRGQLELVVVDPKDRRERKIQISL
jgi:membrane-associated protease RseP (regulator of RpoE activity)